MIFFTVLTVLSSFVWLDYEAVLLKYGSLENIKKSLPKSFIEPHGSFLINFDKIERITKDTVFMKDGLEIPLSQRNLKKIRSIMIEFEREKRNANI